MDNIVVITQNVKLESLHLLRKHLQGKETLIFSTQLVFDNEKQIIEEQLGIECLFLNFSSIMSDADFEECDVNAYSDSLANVVQYYNAIKHLKNLRAVQILSQNYACDNRYIICDDLGLDVDVWLEHGYIKLDCDYYHVEEERSEVQSSENHFKSLLETCKRYFNTDISVANYKGIKHLFYGSLNRIGYRMDIPFKKANKLENIKYLLGYLSVRIFQYYPKNKTIRMSTLHESTQYPLPKHQNANVKILQDGYLPPNYSSKYLLFHDKSVEFYTWDVEGKRTFDYHLLRSRVMPFRKKLYLPKPNFPSSIKKVLCVASGAGDWTALKNRSDEDKMLVAFGIVAAMFPDVEFIYRCHPVWIHPHHQGVNSINRATEYINWLNLPNLRISSNIPNAEENGKFRLSYKRSSFEEDLKDVDIVFGEHSISMIDAAFKQILFGSVNVTGRRDFFCGISAMGFPHCESVEEIATLLKSITSDDFRSGYLKAIDNYNIMTDKE